MLLSSCLLAFKSGKVWGNYSLWGKFSQQWPFLEHLSYGQFCEKFWLAYLYLVSCLGEQSPLKYMLNDSHGSSPGGVMSQLYRGGIWVSRSLQCCPLGLIGRKWCQACLGPRHSAAPPCRVPPMVNLFLVAFHCCCIFYIHSSQFNSGIGSKH